jgi:hypothetical protein
VTRWRSLITLSAAAGLAAALTVAIAPPASAATGSWTINLACDTSGGPPADVVVVEFSFDGLTPGNEGYVAGRHTYGAGIDDYVEVTSNISADGSGHTEGTAQVSKSALTTPSYAPAPGDSFAWRVNLNGEGDVLTGSSSLGGSGCTGSTITAGTPSISGTAKVGEVLTAAPGSWTPDGISFTYQWLADGTAIAGATGPSLSLTAAQLGRAISVSVTGSKTGYTAVTNASAATAAVAPGTLAPTPKPKITGTAKVGKKLTAKPGAWGPGTVDKTYKWLANGKVISGATGKKLKLTAALVGKRIKVKVTGEKAGYTSVSKASKATAKVTT